MSAVAHPRILIDDLFDIIVRSNASDLHLQEGQPPKMRVHGDIQRIRDEVLTGPEMERMLSEVAGPARWAVFQKKGDADLAYELNEDSRFRCNLHRQLHGLGGIFRLIPNKIATLEQLGVPSVVKNFANIKGGLVLVTGPTGSGKSTTLAALVNHINGSYARHIITIEEPIEFVHNNKLSIITQREVGEDTPSFADGLRNAMREDADVVLVGEMRDLETISLALTAAETGLLVFGTLHTNNARKTVDRMIDVFPSNQQPQVRTMLAASLRGIVAQLLLKKADGSGRLAVNEILIANNAVSSIIREGAVEKLTDVLISGKSEGMQFMDDAIQRLLDNGQISPQEAYMKAIDKQRFAPFLEEKKGGWLSRIANSGGQQTPKVVAYKPTIKK
jgi:twitching motility protein PilT